MFVLGLGCGLGWLFYWFMFLLCLLLDCVGFVASHRFCLCVCDFVVCVVVLNFNCWVVDLVIDCLHFNGYGFLIVGFS